MIKKRILAAAMLMLLLCAGAVIYEHARRTRVSRLPAQPCEIVNVRDGSVLVPVSGGEFIMGTDDKIVLFGRPMFRYRVNPFYIGKYEVTNRQYAAFVKQTGYKAQGIWKEYYFKGLDDYPVVCVSWKDATAYCEWAGLRLPTEAEWEKASRGEDGRRHVWGNDWDINKCNNWNLTRKDAMEKMAHFLKKRGTMPVGSFPESVSVYGCWDMAGNVWEWTSTLYRPYPYRADDGREDPTRNEARVMKGASWYSVEPRCLYCAERIAEAPVGMFSHFIGFRVARSL
jgi:formylglycine-generating enzyme required for sulfatase activity